MDVDNSVVIAGGSGDRGTKWQWKKITIKNKVKKNLHLSSNIHSYR